VIALLKAAPFELATIQNIPIQLYRYAVRCDVEFLEQARHRQAGCQRTRFSVYLDVHRITRASYETLKRLVNWPSGLSAWARRTGLCCSILTIYRVMLERNRQVADLFHAFADTLAAENANPHRVRAYRRAAVTLLSLTEDVAAVARRGELQSLPGIGRDLSAKIEEFLATGTILSQSAPAVPLPPEVAAWAKLPGLSESLVQYLYGGLGIRTLDDLETLVRSHLLRTLPGATITEPSLLAAIKALRQHELE